jgi:hypothetical protein
MPEFNFPLRDNHFAGGEGITEGGNSRPIGLTLPRLLNELNARVYSNATRPDASKVPPGSSIWNVDDRAPNWSDGTDWRDAMGNLT